MKELIMNRTVMVVLALLITGWAGWKYKDRIMTMINPPPSADAPSENPDVLYRWVDKDGVTHFDQQADKGDRLEYDGTRVTRADELTGEQWATSKKVEERIEQEIRENKAARASTTAAEPGAEEAPTGSEILDLRNEMERSARQIKAAKDARHDL